MEVGVWRGGSGALIASQSARLIPSAQVFLCDTFTGVVKTGAQDSIYEDGMHADTSPEIVKQLLEQLSLNNAVVLQGIFPEQTAEIEFKIAGSGSVTLTLTCTSRPKTSVSGRGHAWYRMGW
jgi:hypothetical protein